ncbi:MAG: hypothetical protein JSR99_19600 [Proteobacteria bacterium]|nr:hypothetical protein [Pseudomonadota bacterium]
MAIFVRGRCVRDLSLCRSPRTPHAGRLASTVVPIVALLSVLAAGAARAQAGGDGGIVTSEADNHIVRRCEEGSKQEHCYWTKAGGKAVARH